MRVLTTLLTCTIGLPAIGLAADAVPLIPRSALFGNPEKLSPKVSPDGKMLAYIAPDHGVRNIWIRTIGASDDRAVTSERIRPIPEYYWLPDSRSLVYLQDSGGNENFHLYRTDVISKETKDLTPFDKVRSSVVAIDPQHPGQMLLAMNKRNPELFDVYRYSFKTGAIDLDTENPGDVAAWRADHNLEVRAAEVMLPDGSPEIRVRDNAKSPWKSLVRLGPAENLDFQAFTPSNDAIWLASTAGANAERLVEIELASGKVKRVITEDAQYDVFGILTHPRTHALEAVSIIRARAEWQSVDPSLESDFETLRKAHGGDIAIVSQDADGKIWTVEFKSDDSSLSYFLYDRGAKRTQFLFAAIPALDKYKLAKMQPISYPARDGMQIFGYLTMPVGVTKNAPTVMLVHGGPWARDFWGFSPLVQMLSNRGYAVIQPQFRASVGYGKAYLNAGNREWAGKMHNDLLDAKDWAIKQGYSDPKKFCIMGGSYGGYATLVGVTFTPDAFTCGVDIVGPSNLVTLLRTIPPYWVTERAMFDLRMGSLEKDEDFLRSLSPLFKADRIRVPLLIGQGANDPRVNKAESDQIVRAMRDNKKQVQYIVFPDEGHGFRRPENSMRFYAATEQFLARYLGGRAEAPSENEKWDAFVH